MAITEDAGIQFSDFHFAGAEFDGLLEQHGVRDAKLLIAMRCGCWKDGLPDVGCKTCWPWGYVWIAPIDVALHGPSRKPLRRLEDIGMIEPGSAYFTFPTGVVPSFMSRIVLPQSILLADDALEKNVHDISRFTHVVGIEKAHYSVRVPPTGDPYEVENVPLTFDGPTPDITLSGNRIAWNNNAIPDGTPYIVLLRTFAEYLVWDVQDRSEDGKPMPYRALCKRLDFLKHPRSTSDVSFPS
jgi:hypothetical protein